MELSSLNLFQLFIRDLIRNETHYRGLIFPFNKITWNILKHRIHLRSESHLQLIQKKLLLVYTIEKIKAMLTNFYSIR